MSTRRVHLLSPKDAIDEYPREGTEVALVQYSGSGSAIRGWFAFMADDNGNIIAHYNPEMLGQGLDQLVDTEWFRAIEEDPWVATRDSDIRTVMGHCGPGWLDVAG